MADTMLGRPVALPGSTTSAQEIMVFAGEEAASGGTHGDDDHGEVLEL
jgi:hypothetical protein